LGARAFSSLGTLPNNYLGVNKCSDNVLLDISVRLEKGKMQFSGEIKYKILFID